MKNIRTWGIATALATALALPVSALDLATMSENERQEFRAEVRSYLLENPEVIMEAINILEERNAQAQAEADRDLLGDLNAEIFDDGRSWQGGNLDGDITLVEFVDYRCGYCRRAHDEVADLIENDGNIKFIVKEFPILGEESVESSRFAIATKLVGGPDAYKQANDALIQLRGSVNEAALRRLAADLDLDADAIMEKMQDPEVTAELQANHDLARKLEINGTPTFILGDELIRGYVPLAQMMQLVDTTRNGS